MFFCAYAIYSYVFLLIFEYGNKTNEKVYAVQPLTLRVRNKEFLVTHFPLVHQKLLRFQEHLSSLISDVVSHSRAKVGGKTHYLPSNILSKVSMGSFFKKFILFLYLLSFFSSLDAHKRTTNINVSERVEK